MAGRPKTERLANLVAYLYDRRRRAVSRRELFEHVYYNYHTQESSLTRMFERDKNTLRDMGTVIETTEFDNEYTGRTVAYRLSDDSYFNLVLETVPEGRVNRLSDIAKNNAYASSALLKLALGTDDTEEVLRRQAKAKLDRLTRMFLIPAVTSKVEATIETLCRVFNESGNTIRRDLQTLSMCGWGTGGGELFEVYEDDDGVVHIPTADCFFRPFGFSREERETIEAVA